MKLKRIFSLSRLEVLYIFIIIVVGIDIFFTASLIEPLQRVQDKTAQSQQIAIEGLRLQVQQLLQQEQNTTT